jgi:hypothetical protein
MDDFPGETDNPRADRRQSRDRDASQGGEGCNKDLRASATVAGGWRNEAGRVLREQWIVGGGLGRIGCIRRRHVLTIQKWMEEAGDGVVGG